MANHARTSPAILFVSLTGPLGGTKLLHQATIALFLLMAGGTAAAGDWRAVNIDPANVVARNGENIPVVSGVILPATTTPNGLKQVWVQSFEQGKILDRVKKFEKKDLDAIDAGYPKAGVPLGLRALEESESKSANAEANLGRAYYITDYVVNHGMVRPVMSEKVEIDCAVEKFRLLQVYEYSADGRALSDTHSSVDWQYAAPGTMADAYSRMACDQVK